MEQLIGRAIGWLIGKEMSRRWADGRLPGSYREKPDPERDAERALAAKIRETELWIEEQRRLRG